jgi:putative MATE family efflux protein
MKTRTRKDMLGNEKVGRLLYKLSLPAMIGMMVQALYNVVDTIFVGKGVGTLGIGGIAVVFPIQMLTMAIAQTIGIGGASRISRRMGAGDMDGAALTFGNMVLLALILGISIMISCMIAATPLLRLFGATETILPYATQYFQVFILATPLMAFSMASNNAARAEGNAKVAMTTMLIGAGMNIVLDPFFIFVLDMGIRGAAVATVISIGTTSLFLLGYFISGRSEIPVSLKYFHLEGGIIREILAVGSSAFVRAGSMSLTAILLNNILRTFGGAIGIATFGIIFRMLSFIFMPIMGLTQGMQPIVGFNYGARRFSRVRQSVKLASVFSVLVTTTGFLALMLFPETIMRIFSNDPKLVDAGRDALRYCVLCLPLAGYQIIGGGVFQALGKPIPALLLTLSRQVLILIPLISILPHFFGINGVWFSFPAADSISFALTFTLVFWTMKRLPETPAPEVPVVAPQIAPNAPLSPSFQKSPVRQ